MRVSDPWVIGGGFTPKELLHDGGDGEWVLASGRFRNSEGVLAIRWNGKQGSPLGFPQMFGNSVWFVVPDQLALGLADLVIKQRVRRRLPDV